MTSYETIYPGVESISPSYYSPPISSYQSSIRNIGMSVDPRTANQLGEINTKLNPGVKTIEVQGVIPKVFEAIPEQHLDEIRRQMKLVGVTPSLHGPIIEFSGIGEGGWTEENRLGAEKQLQSAVLRGHKLDPKGNISVTVHSTSQLPELRPHIIPEKGEKIEQGLWVINEETGQYGLIRPEKRYFPEKGEFTGKEIEFKATKELNRKNEEEWTNMISNVNRYAEYGEEILNRIRVSHPNIYNRIGDIGKIEIDKIEDEEDKKIIKDVQRTITHSQIYLRDSYRNMKQLFDRAWANVENEEDKKRLKEFAEEIRPQIIPGIESDPGKLEQLRNIVERGLKTLSNVSTPKILKPLDEFVIKKSAETFANVAESAYNKFGNTSPIINIENPPAGQGLSTAEDLRNLVIESRKQLAKNLSDKGMSRGQAENVAEKMIGATWDVGHINMLRKKGYSEKDIIKQTKIIAPLVKHVHLSDNFGMEHTELPMGMGNVPLKPMMNELKKAGFKGKEIIEAGDWWQHHAEHGGGNPFKPSIEAFDSPIYAMKEGPGWANTGRYGAYYFGYGPVNPPIHHKVYGTGFETLPIELGGEIPGDRGRFAGTPNQ